MKKLVMGCAMVGLIALSPRSEAKGPIHIGPLPMTLGISKTEVGMASWYGIDRQGKPTASGELFDNRSLTAAHRKLPFGTTIRVTNLETFESLLLRINDRGPGVAGRLLDVTTAVAKQLGFLKTGLARVEIEVVSLPRINLGQLAAAHPPDLN